MATILDLPDSLVPPSFPPSLPFSLSLAPYIPFVPFFPHPPIIPFLLPTTQPVPILLLPAAQHQQPPPNLPTS